MRLLYLLYLGCLLWLVMMVYQLVVEVPDVRPHRRFALSSAHLAYSHCVEILWLDPTRLVVVESNSTSVESRSSCERFVAMLLSLPVCLQGSSWYRLALYGI